VKRHRILLAEPDAQTLTAHRLHLSRLGYDVAACADGLDCAERLRRDRPDVLVLDPDLPWGAGEGILALIGDGELPAVPVVLVTAHPAPYLSFPIGRYPIRAFLGKPVAPERLELVLRFAIGVELIDVPRVVEPAPVPPGHGSHPCSR
jgi:CheY-like chemotaxis protein